ncbi:metal ABC transporter substrate-binding protein [Aureimonas psammosilenae]|uniref:metal ABC transporter substrate-binding protein n=1 Tax=Aureimonas psammosilenae TaxID=2495496 RepID=UPI0012608BD5|nr:metal ABC transporter substrate-binding protein [Aureimonas psammosilenae]
MLTRRFILALGCATMLAGATPASADDKLKVVASFSVLGDVVREVGGSHVDVSTLIGPNGDPHEYEPAPDDAKRLRDAQVVFVSGLGLEGFMDRLVKASGFKGEPVVASANIKPLDLEEEAGHDHNHEGHDHGHEHDVDPHVWNDPKNVESWVGVIEQALAKADPSQAESFKTNAARYTAELQKLDAFAKAEIGKTPKENRRILTSHDAFGYFGAAYGVTFLSPVGLSTESEASARDVAKLIDQIKAEKIRTYFFENSNDPRLVRQIAQATGAEPGGELYVESLSGPDGPASTYAKMFRHNVELVAGALSRTN